MLKDNYLKINYNNSYNYLIFIIILYLALGFALSFYYPVGNDAGKYLRVIKLVADGSVLKKDVSPGTVEPFSIYLRLFL